MFTISKTLNMKKLLLLSVTFCCILTATHTQAQTQITFYTSKGKFVVEMYETPRPITTKNFIGLVKKKFYDKLIFHRVIKNFVIQGGDPKGDGTGGTGFPIKDELTPPVSNVLGTIAMANSGPNTAESQFYINLKDNTGLDPNYPAFGKVISGISVVQAIGVVPTNSNDKPLTAVTMDSVRITPIATGLDELLNDDAALTIFPNPVTTESTIWMESPAEKTVQISIYNQQGQRMAEQEKKLTNGTNTISIKEIFETDLSPGVYYLTVTDGTVISRKKFVRMD
jgi:cyclophilin family peptidyl-prolyl cis-trans isomerase